LKKEESVKNFLKMSEMSLKDILEISTPLIIEKKILFFKWRRLLETEILSRNWEYF